MRICYAHTGINIQDHIFLKFFAERGHDVHLVTFYDDKRDLPNMYGLPKIEGLKIHHKNTDKVRFPTKFMDFFFQFPVNTLLIKKLLKKIKPDILNGNWIPTYGLYSALSGFHPFLLTVWGSDILIIPKISGFARFVSKYVVRSADAIIVDSIVQEDAIVELGYERKKIVRFPWGVDLERFNPGISGKDVRKKLGWDEYNIIFFGRWHEKVCGFDYFIRSVPLILEKRKDTRFIIAGTGSLTDEFKKFVIKNKLDDYVNFVGRLSWEEMPRYISASDIYVSPAISDGSSVAVLEGMACGKAVAVSDIPGNREWVENGENGLFFPVKNSEAIAEKIIMLIEDISLSKKLGKKAAETIKKRADLKKGLIKYEKTMEELVKG